MSDHSALTQSVINMSSPLCLVVEGFTAETSAQVVGRYASDKTGFSFDKIAGVVLYPGLNKPNVWVLPLYSLEDQKKCLEVLDGETIPDGTVEEAGLHVSLSLISLCLLPPNIPWTELHRASDVDTSDYSIVDHDEKDQEQHSHPSVAGGLDYSVQKTLSLALSEAFESCSDDENKESLAVDNNSDGEEFANEDDNVKTLDTRDVKDISPVGNKDLTDSSTDREDRRERSPAIEDKSTLHGDGDIVDRDDFTEISAGKNDSKLHASDRKGITDSSFDIGDRSFAKNFGERSPEREICISQDTAVFKGSSLSTVRDNNRYEEDFKGRSPEEEDFTERSPEKEDFRKRLPEKEHFREISPEGEDFTERSPEKGYFREMSPDTGNVSERPPDRQYTREGSPEMEDIRDSSPVRRDFGKRSPDREDFRDRSTAGADFRDGSLDREEFRDRSTAGAGFRVGSPDREELRNRSTAGAGFRDGFPDREEFRGRSTAGEGFRDGSPQREDFGDSSTAGAGFGGGSPDQEDENNSHTEEDVDEDRDDFDEDDFDEDNVNGNQVDNNQIDMYKLLCAVKLTSVPVTCLQAALINSEQTRNYILDKFKEEDLMAVLQPYDALSTIGTAKDMVTVRAFSDDDLVSAGVIIRSSVREHVIRLSEKTADLLTLQTWAEMCQALHEKYEGHLLMNSEGPDNITIVGTDDIMDEVVKEVTRFIEENTIHTAICRLSPYRHKFLVLFGREKIKTANKQLKAYRVEIDVVWKKKLGELRIMGTEKGLPLAEAELRKMESEIVCHTVKEKDHLRVKFLTHMDPDHLDDLMDLAQDTRCVLTFRDAEAALKVRNFVASVAEAIGMRGDRDSAPSASSVPFQDEKRNVSQPKTLSASRKSGEDLIRVSVVQGDLSEEQTDVIVNTTTARLELRAGTVSASLLNKGGPALQAECIAKYPHGIRAGDIAITQGCGQLRCRQIYHTTLPGYSMMAKRLLYEVIGDCLEEASKHNYRSIAFPALGTGVLGYPCDEVAMIMLRTVSDFQREVPHTSLREVRILIYYSDDESLLAFQEAQRQFQENPSLGAVAASPYAGVGPRPVVPYSGEQEAGRKQGSSERDVHPDKPEFLSPGRADVTERPSQTKAPKPKSDELELELFLYTENKSTTCVQDFLQKLDKVVHKRMITREVLDETLEAFTEDEEQLIDALGRMNDVKVQLHRRDGRLTARGFRLDVTDVLKEISDLTNTVADRLHQERQVKELEMTRPPSSWVAHKPTEHVKLVRLSPADPEYKNVEGSFNTTSWRHGPLMIISIDRVQNPTLWRQYVAKRIHLDKQNHGLNNERTLWHGTLDTNVCNINLNGFNRGYCGKNATSYGEGVYFAVDSGVSKQPTYSPPDAQGLRYVYQSKVLVGHYTEGNRRMKVPPARDGPILYDSLVDDQRRPSVFVIFNDTQAYPEYLITFSEGAKMETSVVDIRNN